MPGFMHSAKRSVQMRLGCQVAKLVEAKTRVLLTCGILVAFILGGLPGAANARVLDSRATTLVVPYVDEVGGVDPAVFYNIEGGGVTQSVYEGLLRYQAGGTGFEPVLAVSWDISGDGKTYTFHLRHNVLFQDGTPFNSAAVEFTFQRISKVNQGPAYMLANVARYETPDPYTFRVVLRQPEAPFLNFMASMWGPKIVSPTFVRQHEVKGDLAQNWLPQHAVGTGPYMLTRYVSGNEYVLEKNPTYWRGWSGLHVDKIIFKIIPEMSTERLALERGDVDMVMHNMPVTDIAALQKESGIIVEDFPTNLMAQLNVNVARGATANPRVRQALAYTIPYQQIVDTILRGHGTVMHSPYPASFTVSRTALWPYTQNIARARALLAAAGYPHGGFTLDFAYSTDSVTPWRQAAELWQAELATLNIKMTIRALPVAIVYAGFKTPASAPQILATNQTPDAIDPFTWSHIVWASTGALNFSFYSSKAVDSMINTAEQTLGTPQLSHLYTEIGDTVATDVPMIFVAQIDDTFIMRSNVHGVTHNVAYPWTTDYYKVYKS